MISRWRSILIWSIGLIAIMFIIVNGVVHFATPKKMPTTVAVSLTPLSAPFYVAQAINAFDDTCVSVQVIDVIGGMRAFDKVLRGETEFSTASDSVMAYQSIMRDDFVSHAMFVQSDNDVKLISRQPLPLDDLDKLKSLTFGVTIGTASEYFLSTVLALKAIDIQDVTMVHFAPENLPNALNDQLVDAIVPWEPYGYKTTQMMAEQAVVHDTKNFNSLSFNLISLRADSEAQVEKASCLLSGLIAATEFIAVNPTRAKQIVQQKLALEQGFIDWVWQDYIFKVGIDNSLLLSLEAQVTWTINQSERERIIFASENINKFIDSRALSRIAPRSVHIR